MEHKISEPNARVDVADVLRGLAVMGIIILHSIEHFNFYSFPDTVPCEWMKFTDKAIWNGLFFVFSNKAYAIFALLFGFSFYIQDNNQQRRGKDFRLRFIWRMALLFIIGQFNAAFFTGEILTMYAMLGLILPLSCRLIPGLKFLLYRQAVPGSALLPVPTLFRLLFLLFHLTIHLLKFHKLLPIGNLLHLPV